MRDQASSLRELKAKFDRLQQQTRQETPEEFLATLKRQSPLCATVLIYPDELQATYPSIGSWFPKIVANPSDACLWDQANLLKSVSNFSNSSDSLTIPVLPRQAELLTIQKKNYRACSEFLKEISNKLREHNEVWITMKASEIPYYSNIIKAAEILCLMIPDNSETTIKCYESVKNICVQKKEPSITLLRFSSKPYLTEDSAISRIKNVAKQFLGIDLTPMGVVLSSGRYFPNINEGNLSSMKSPTNLSSSDFMHTFSENIVYNSLGIK